MILNFLAGNMRHLKQFSVSRVNDAFYGDLMRAYQEIQSSSHLYVNTTFELVVVEEGSFNVVKDQFIY